jgi:hypothetical protein
MISNQKFESQHEILTLSQMNEQQNLLTFLQNLS